jgi:hypothetical protein
MQGPIQASPFNAVASGLGCQHEQTGDMRVEEQGDLEVDEERKIDQSSPYVRSLYWLDVIQPAIALESDKERYNAVGIEQDKVHEYCEIFDSKVRGLVQYLVQHANDTLSNGPDGLMTIQFYTKLRASKADKLGDLFQRVIPTSTKAILGNPNLCEDHLLFLPHIGPENKSKGVYLDYITDTDPKGNGLYIGSTV